ncbi:FAST kinase domain-containing protein 5, mitochondrial-like isoform X1 [Rhodnius prolixus]|uniref:FAST kinase domain-containing protein 5, mitochondrial-like isoform X1 n=1 Tax=Rhodnius prolixus TaxID=13249 RepID=UPI003D18D8B4
MVSTYKNTYMLRCFHRKLFYAKWHSSLASDIINREGKKFIESENKFAHSIMANLPQYKNSLAPVFAVKEVQSDSNERISVKNNIPWDKLPLNELCEEFKSITLEARMNSTPITNECYGKMCTGIAKRCLEMPDENLVTLLGYLHFWPYAASPKEGNFYLVWKALDNACLSRWKSWDINKIFLFTDLWYNLHLTRQSDYVYRSIKKTATNPSRLVSHQIVQLLFYLNVLRSTSEAVSMYNIEYQLEKIVHTLAIEEIGIAALGFFKTQSVVNSDKLKGYIIDRVIQEKDTIPEVTLSAILKMLRANLTIPLWERIPPLMDALETQVDRMSLLCTTHIILLGAKSLTLHEGTLTKVSQKLSVGIKNARLKEMEKVLYPLTLLNFNPNTDLCIFERVVNELNDPKRIAEFDQYPKSLVALLYYLTLREIFVEKPIAKILEMEYIRKTYGRTNFVIGREILGIDTYIEVMQPPYSGPRLPSEIRNYLSKRYSTFVPDPNRKLTKHTKFYLDIYQIATELFGNDCVMYKYIVPHHSRPDLVFHLNSDGQPLPIPEDYKKIEDFTGPVKSTDKGTWYSLIAASRNMFVHNVPVLTGETLSKLNLMKKLGYKPILVSYHEWPSEKQEKLNFLKRLIYS